jgi:uncharacterized repeat protein (TIGR03803 family)
MHKHGLNSKRTSASLALGLVLAGALPVAASAATADVSMLTKLNMYGGYANTPLTNDGQGNLIGAVWYSTVHGQYSNGTVFSVAPNGSPTTLHSFAIDEGAPGGPVARGSDGSTYGVTEGGGTNNTGSVFRIAPDGTFTELHSFAAPSSSSNHANADGYDPVSLAMGKDGALYGVAQNGGSNDLGTVFRVTTDGQFSLLYTFAPVASSGVDANEPCSILSGSDGALYGTTLRNGTPKYGYGSIFKITTDGQLSILNTLTNQTSVSCPTLTQGHDGNFYGTVESGGLQGNISTWGIVYKLTPGGQFTTLHTFTSKPESSSNAGGENPVGVIQASDGNLYGATNRGGSTSAGVLYQLTTDGQFTRLYTFPKTLNGYPFGYPTVNIVQGTDGALYGATAGQRSTSPAIFKAVISP